MNQLISLFYCSIQDDACLREAHRPEDQQCLDQVWVGFICCHSVIIIVWAVSKVKPPIHVLTCCVLTLPRTCTATCNDGYQFADLKPSVEHRCDQFAMVWYSGPELSSPCVRKSAFGSCCGLWNEFCSCWETTARKIVLSGWLEVKNPITN